MESDFFFRILVALALGALIGSERQLRNHEGGLKTNALVAMGSALFVTMAQQFSEPDRIVAQILPGIGFLGAGMIMRDAVVFSRGGHAGRRRFLADRDSGRSHDRGGECRIAGLGAVDRSPESGNTGRAKGSVTVLIRFNGLQKIVRKQKTGHKNTVTQFGLFSMVCVFLGPAAWNPIARVN
jgi:hypothetical protein